MDALLRKEHYCEQGRQSSKLSVHTCGSSALSIAEHSTSATLKAIDTRLPWPVLSTRTRAELFVIFGAWRLHLGRVAKRSSSCHTIACALINHVCYSRWFQLLSSFTNLTGPS